jgi:adenosylmethionine-8-amino-7-oxononanoate aminotransferase
MADPDDLEALARKHLWMHFSRLGTFDDEHPVAVLSHGEGCHVWTEDGRRWLDALSGLFVVQVGHGRRELADVAAEQAARLAYFPIWGLAHEPAIRLAARLAAAAPGDLDRVFFTAGGSEAVESAWKLARQHFRAIGQPQRTKVIAREGAYHGVTLGALSITGVPALRDPFEPLVPGASHVANTNRYHHPLGDDEDAFSTWAADAIAERIEAEGPETVAAVFLEPMQNAGGCITPPAGYFQRVREICDRYGVLLVSDEVICAFGRLGTMFGCERYGYEPDMITTAKGLTSGYSPLGALIASERVVAPFLEGAASFTHGFTFGGHPVSCAVALANLDIIEREGLLANVRANEDGFGRRLDGLRDIPIVGDVRGDGYFWAIELTKDQATKERFALGEADALLRRVILPRYLELGVYCRVDDRVDPVIQFAPMLIAGPDELDTIEEVSRTVLSEAWKHLEESRT